MKDLRKTVRKITESNDKIQITSILGEYIEDIDNTDMLKAIDQILSTMGHFDLIDFRFACACTLLNSELAKDKIGLVEIFESWHKDDLESNR